MAEKFDATSRLAEGLPAVGNVQNYVWACHLIGYQNPDLTLHASQVRDWYGSEDGLDLSALDADCAAFDAAMAATEQALVRQGDQLAAISGAWSGYGAEVSREFLRRHGEASASAAAAVRTAADVLASLRDRLWQAVDGKVATALAIEDRVLQRGEWLAAAQTVTTGAGDRSAASELIDQQVKPFVDNDIRADWLTAMRAALSAVTDSYEAATAELTAELPAVFDVPGDLGPSWTPPPRGDDGPTTPAAAASSPPPVGGASSPPVAGAPASWSAPAAQTPPLIAPAPPPATPLEPTAPAMAPTASMPAMGGGIPEFGSGLSGFGQQLADTLSGLMGSADDALADTPELNEELEEPDDLKEPDDELEEPAEPDEDEPIEEPVSESACQEQPADAAAPVEAPVEPPPPEPAPTPAPLPPPPEPLPPPEPAAATETPCEIAAEELPQVGE